MDTERVKSATVGQITATARTERRTKWDGIDIHPRVIPSDFSAVVAPMRTSHLLTWSAVWTARSTHV